MTMPTSSAIAITPALGVIPEHSIVRLRHAKPEVGLKAGAEGTMVLVYADGEDYEVEFSGNLRKLCLVTLSAQDLELID